MGRKTLLTMTGAVYIVAAIIAAVIFLKSEAVTIPDQNMPVQASVYAEEDGTSIQESMAEDSNRKPDVVIITETKAVMAEATRTPETKPVQSTQQTKEQSTRQPKEQSTAVTKAAAKPSEKVTDSPMLKGEYTVLYKAAGTQPTLTIRKAPDNNGNIAGWLPQGAECEVLAENVGGWTLIRYKGCTGFVYGRYLKAVN